MHLGPFGCLTKHGAKWDELVQKFVPRSRVGIFCNERTRSTPLDHKLKFWCVSYYLGAFVEKNSDTDSWHELLHQFGPFCTEFRKSTKRSQMHPNFMKCTKTFVRVQWGGSGAFVAKNSDATSWHELLHQFGPFCTEFRKSTKRSPMHQNCT